MKAAELVAFWGEVIRFVRWLNRWTQEVLFEKTGIDQSLLSKYERGEVEPGFAQRERIAEVGRVPLRVWGFIAHCLELIRRAIASETAVAPPQPGRGRGAEELREAAWRPVSRALDLARAELALLRGSTPGWQPRPPTAAESSAADRLVATLQRSSAADRLLLIEGAASFRHWLVCLRLCAASERAAAHAPADALQLAELAGFIAERVPGPAAWLARLRGCCLGFVANAQKTAGELQLAEATFDRAWRSWKAGVDPAGVLSEACLLDLEASLRWAQRRFPQAIRLHDQALAVARPAEIGFILLNKAGTLGDKGDHAGSISALELAAREVDPKQEPRLFTVLRFNLAANLLRLKRVEEAEPIVKEVRKLTNRLGNAIDTLRTRWLEGNLHVGLGERAAAVAVFEEVRAGFAEMPFDHALVSLDLALVYRDEGRFPEVAALAVEMLKVFKAQGVHREAIGALLLFKDAAEKGAVSESLVRRLQDYLGRARAVRGLRFDG